MKSSIKSYLINGPFGDPGLIVNLLNNRRSILFDLGDISKLSSRQTLNISDIFISHTHIDHFFGFDKIIRLFLGKNKEIYFFGPPGLFRNIEGKLAGYNWNMVKNYKEDFIIHVREIDIKNIKCKTYCCNKEFKSRNEKKYYNDGHILLNKNIIIKSVVLDHGIPCIGYSLEKQSQIKIITNKFKSINLISGKWANLLKKKIQTYLKIDKLNSTLNIKRNIKDFNTFLVAKKICDISKEEKISYVTDVVFSKKNITSILELVNNSSHLFIEATFTTKHEKMAKSKYHLTAKQAGKIARISKTKKYTLFHHSPRYYHNVDKLLSEANEEYSK